MRLFELTEEREVALNKAWIMLIPELKALLVRDKGSKGDTQNRKKLRATREFTFIYFYTDFSSPIRDWEDEERKTEALYYSGLTAADLDDKVWTANDTYFQLMLKSSRPLRTLKALYKGLDAMDEHFESVNFADKDKMGKLLHDPSDFVTNAGKLNKMYDEIKNFEKRVEDDMKQASATIRGPNSTLGDNEGQTKVWDENDILQGSRHSASIGTTTDTTKKPGSFQDILEITRQQATRERIQQDAPRPKKDTITLGDVFDEEEEL